MSINPQSKPKALTDSILGYMTYGAVALILIGLLLTAVQPIADRITSILLAMACILLGVFLGFLFGIPRVLQMDEAARLQILNKFSGDDATVFSKVKPGTVLSDSIYQQQVNTNLEQISDWLTKIIVGLGLVNLYKIPPLLRSTSKLIANDFAKPKQVESTIIFVNALILYFPLLGFLIGYLFTRIYLSSVFRIADTGQLLKIDIEGETVPLEDVVRNLVNVAADAQPVKQASTPKLEQENITPIPNRILWVDDNPGNITVERSMLKKAGIEVLQALSTTEGLAILNNSQFDMIITDMAREENGIYNRLAGIDFLKLVKEKGINNCPIVFYTDLKNKVYAPQVMSYGGQMAFGVHELMKMIGFK